MFIKDRKYFNGPNIGGQHIWHFTDNKGSVCQAYFDFLATLDIGNHTLTGPLWDQIPHFLWRWKLVQTRKIIKIYKDTPLK